MFGLASSDAMLAGVVIFQTSLCSLCPGGVKRKAVFDFPSSGGELAGLPYPKLF